MKNIMMAFGLILAVGVLAGCCPRCEVEPIVEQNQRLIVPPNFGAMPTA